MKIFLGLTNNAGILTRLKKGFNQNGVEADFYSYEQHIFGYETDKVIKYSSNIFLRAFQKLFLIIKLLVNYKCFIFDSGNTLLPNFMDVKIFKFFNKKILVIYTGCDVRIPESVAQYKWNPCTNCTDEYKSFVGCIIENKKIKISEVEKFADIIVCPSEAGGYLRTKYNDIFFPVNIDEFNCNQEKAENKKIKILHIPSDENYKGTKYINIAIEKLKQEYDFEFKIVKNVDILTVYKEINECDLLVDQMLVGFYGLIAIEALALCKPVVCYIREDIWNTIKKDCPIFNSNPDTLYNDLKQILDTPQQLKERSKMSREYALRYHDSKKIAAKYLELLLKR
jgi:hypothetical protein